MSGRIRFFPQEPAAKHIQILTIFIIWCVFSAFALPVLFDGVPMDPPRADVGADSVGFRCTTNTAGAPMQCFRNHNVRNTY